jgi:SAM-dependent methyltransferase
MGFLQETKRLLTTDEVTRGYHELNGLYPHIPPLIVWRGWEYAAYRRFTLGEPVLDVGCGDGRFFRLVWPEIQDVVGLDIDSDVVEAAKNAGIYRKVHVAPAYDMPFESGGFASAFANCSLEHMDDLTEVLRHIARCLRPGGKFVFSVVTSELLDWTMLPLLLRIMREPDRANALHSSYLEYHHMANVFSSEEWVHQLSESHLLVEGYIPIVPELTARFFLFLDQLWHLPFQDGELGHIFPGVFATWPNFGSGFEEILRGFLLLERDWDTCAGAVFCARKTP